MKYLKYIIAFCIVKEFIVIVLINKYKEIVISTLAMKFLFLILIIFLYFVLKRTYKKGRYI